MYPFILGLHNIVRWFVLILGIVAAVLAWLGYFRQQEWRPMDSKFGSYFGIAMDIQLLLGLLLYFIFSPLTRTALQDFGAAMSSNDLRFFAVEHVFYMLLAVIFAHLGTILPRRASEARSQYRRAAIAFSLSVLVILFGMPWMRPLFPHFG